MDEEYARRRIRELEYKVAENKRNWVIFGAVVFGTICGSIAVALYEQHEKQKQVDAAMKQLTDVFTNPTDMLKGRKPISSVPETAYQIVGRHGKKMACVYNSNRSISDCSCYANNGKIPDVSIDVCYYIIDNDLIPK